MKVVESNNGPMANSSFLSVIEDNDPMANTSFLSVIEENLRTTDKDTIYASWYDEKGRQSKSYTYHEIWEESGKVACYLSNVWGILKGERVILCYMFGLHFFSVFLGCLRAGVVPILVYPPAPPLSKSLGKLAKVIEDCKPSLILTDTFISRLRSRDRKNPLSKTRSLWPIQVSFKITDGLP
jgi:acyl-CoA synthetase (AMP-forming)/AMP-acid ligase II